MAYSPYKMKGHTLPGIKQRTSPAKIAPLVAIAGKAILGKVAGKAAGAAAGKAAGGLLGGLLGGKKKETQEEEE